MDVYNNKITNIIKDVSSKSSREIKKLIRDVEELFEDPQEQRHVMTRIYNELTPRQRMNPKLDVHSSFGNAVPIPATPTATVPVPPPVAAPVAQPQAANVAQPTASVTPAVTPNYNQLASLATSASQLAQQASQAAALTGQGAFGRSHRSMYRKHGNFFDNSYLKTL